MYDFATLRQRMVDNQIRPSDVTDRELIRAFLSAPREIFVGPAERPFSYSDRALKLPASGGDRRMIDPVQLARLVQALRLGPQSKAMVIGCGTGYSAAIMARLAGTVIAVEEDEALAAFADARLRELGLGNARVVRARLVEGCAEEAPYDAILIDGAVEFVPDALMAQLKPDGRLAVIERQERISRAMLYERVGPERARWPQFETWAALLPGFERKREFVF
ncbi:MAG: protein-L-isoaspartate O-methyltransferase [Pseudomonadota bacterium]|jgi:protein-L-isoaspartate(D-aspartate) O-methyltransferase|nr:protein-L-isoaspartate O-methyltransferase [Pseudomonadota bacterium]